MTNNRSWVAGGTIGVSLFVTQVVGTNHTVIQSVADDFAVGISLEASNQANLPGQAANPAAVIGESCRIYGLNENCEVTAGAAIQAGNLLKPNAAGQAIPAVANDKYSARAVSNAAVGEKCQVIVERGVA